MIRMEWWQVVLTAVIPALFTAGGFVAQQMLTLRGESAAAKRETAAKWHDRRYELVTECVDLTHLIEQSISGSGAPKGPDDDGDRAPRHQVTETRALIARAIALSSRAAFVVSPEAGTELSRYAKAASEFADSVYAEPFDFDVFQKTTEAVVRARFDFIRQAREDCGLLGL